MYTYVCVLTPLSLYIYIYMHELVMPVCIYLNMCMCIYILCLRLHVDHHMRLRGHLLLHTMNRRVVRANIQGSCKGPSASGDG